MSCIRKIILYCAVLLTACGAGDVKDEASIFYAVPKGSVLILNQEVAVAGGQVAVYMQDGELMSYKDINKYRPNCKFEIYTMSERSRDVQPGSFEIVKVVDEIESSSLKNDVQLAALDFSAERNDFAMGMLDHSLVFNYATMMFLKSDEQKDVYRMTCQHWEAVMDDRHLSIAQMRQAMGDVFTLKLKK